MNTSLALNDWSFLAVPQDQFSLDLSRATLVECIDEYAKVKSKLHASVAGSTRNVKLHINRLQDALHIEFRVNQITSIFYSHFVKYLQDQGLKLTSIKVICDYLRAIIAWASDYNAIVHPSYKEIDIPKYKRQMLALTADDVSRIYHFDLNNAKIRADHRATLERVRDMFVLSCNLGQRVSDMARIDKECFDIGRFSIVQQKTKQRAVVDIARMCLDRRTVFAILERYGYQPPYAADKSNYNKHIHQLMHLVFGEEMVNQSITTGNLSAQCKIPKYKAISSHTCRRTFATYNYLERKMPAIDVMRGTGHADEKSFQRYICGMDDE